MAPRLNVTRARQGRSGKPVLWVLGISLVLVVLAFAGVYATNHDELSRAPAVTPGAEANYAMPEPTPRQNTDAPPPARDS